MKNETTTRWYNLGEGDRLVSIFDGTMDEARAAAVRWNADEERPHQIVHFVSDTPQARYATRLSAIYGPAAQVDPAQTSLL